MSRDISTTKLQDEALMYLKDADNITTTIMGKLFAYHKNGGIKFYTDDIIKIGPGQSKFVKPDTLTTIGIYIANKFIYERLEVFGYINKTLNGKMLSKIDDQLAEAIKNGDVKPEVVADFLDRCQFLYGGSLAHIINTSITANLITLPKAAREAKKKLFEENYSALKGGNPQVSAAVEQEITDVALNKIREKNDPAIALFDSGCGIDPYNNYKTMFVMKGAIIDNTGESPTGYKTIMSNYNDGITKDDMPIIADSLVTGAYSKGVSTQDSGYLAKKYNAIFQRIKLGPKGSDCGSKRYKSVMITDNNKSDYGQYRYILDGSKLVMLTPETVDKYVGKVVKMRSPLYCEYHDPEYCNVCCGDREYRVGVKNIGLAMNLITGSLLNAGMKKFHDIRVKVYPLEIEDLTKFNDYSY